MNDMTDTNDRVSDEVAQRIDAMAGGLPKSVAPPDTMWTGIEGRIDTGSGRSGWLAGWTQGGRGSRSYRRDGHDHHTRAPGAATGDG